MSCTSYAGDIQTRLYNLGAYGLYPEHSDEYKRFTELPRVQFPKPQNPSTSALEFGSIVQMLDSGENMFYIGYVHAVLFSETKHIKGIKAPNSTRYRAFVDSEDRIHLIGSKAQLNSICIIVQDDTESPMCNHISTYEDALCAMQKCAHLAEPMFFELGSKKKLDIVFVMDKKFKGEDLECKYIQTFLKVHQLIYMKYLSATRHFIKDKGMYKSFPCSELVDPKYSFHDVQTLTFYISTM